MAASVHFRPQNRNLGMVMREVDENLAIFLGMRNVEKEGSEHLIKDSDELDESAERKSDGVLESNVLELENVQSAADENSLNLEIDENDYDWLYAQPDSTLHPPVELEVKDSEFSLTEITNGGGIALESKWSTPNSTGGVTSANEKSGDRRKTTRAATPTTGKSALPAKSKSSRASTPTFKPTILSAKPTSANSRSSTPVRATPRSSTPVGRPSIPVNSKPASRSTTPTCKPATILTTSGVSGSVRKIVSTTMKNLGSRASNPSEILSLSHGASENPKILMPKRTVSASRGRPNGHTTNLSCNGKRRQKSCSPAKARAPIVNTAYKHGSMLQTRSLWEDDVNPVLMGSKMVERVVNMRKLAPPKQDEHSTHDNSKKSSHDNSGFGRSLSKKSLDMAIRHMEIRRSIPDDLRAIATRVASSVSAKYAAAGITESPLTSSSDSSKSSIYNNSRFLDGSETEDSVSVDSKLSAASSQ